MRRITIITAILAALCSAAPASGALLASSCGSSCSTLTADGRGDLSVVGSGAEWGSIGSGTVWVRDRTGNSNPRNWVHGTNIHWTSVGDDGFKGTSTHSMTVSATGKFWVKLSGPSIDISSVVDGTGAISGSGTYNLNGHKHAWPGSSQALRF